MKKNISVSKKLAFQFTFILAFVVILLTFCFSRFQLLDLHNQRDFELQRSVKYIDRHLDQYINLPDGTKPRIPPHIYYSVYENKDNETILIYSSNEESDFFPITEKRSKILSPKLFSASGDAKLIYFSARSEVNPSYTIQAWIDLQNDSLYKMKQAFPRLILISLIPLLIICFFIAWSIASRMMKPVIKMTSSARDISSSNLDTLLPEKNNGDELDELAKTFNDLFRRLKIDFDRERQFTSDVSHELKTPVAVILGQANLLRRWGKDDPEQLNKSISTIISETKSMDAIIQNLLQMTRLESGRVLPAKEEFPLIELTSKLQQELLTLDSSAKINFDFDEKLSLVTDYELLHQTMMIIISNSLKFCPKPLELKFSAVKENNMMKISISDNGPGFGSETVNHVFERFYRGDDSHTRNAGGSGLGLSIAKTIIESLGGTISASNDETSKGAKLTVIL